jgi:hypothetical protein
LSFSEFNVEYMARMLKIRKNAGGPPTVLFLGSRTGSLFRHSFLADLLTAFSNRNLSNMTPVERFHECYRILEDFKRQNQDRDIHAIIRKALHEKRVEVADLCVAELMKQGIFDLIITTNIGSELEEAFRQSGMIEHRDFEAVISEPHEPLSGGIAKGHGFKIIKASGDVFSERYSICGYGIGSKEFFLDKHPTLKASIEQIKEENMLMVGFDYRWDRHFIRAGFPRRVGSLWYVNEEQTREDSLLSSYLQDYAAMRLEDTTGEYEPFFMKLCNALGIIPTSLTNQMTLHTQKREETPRTSNDIHQPPPMADEQSQPKQSPTNKADLPQRDFFVSYNSRDRRWGVWIAWELERAGYSVFIQAWDFLPGGNFVLDMQRAASQSKRTIAVLSEDYLKAPFPQSEWAAAFVQDPTGEHQTLLPVRVRECEPMGILKAIGYIDLVGFDEAEARRRLLNGVGLQRRKPDVSPLFPGPSRTVPETDLAAVGKSDPLLPEHPPYPQNLPPTTEVVKVFYVYSPADEALRERIEVQLGLLRQMGLICEWHDGKIIAGTEWAVEIQKHWEEAQVILLLVSADFISSRSYDLAKEAVERHKAKNAVVIPIILSPVDWEGAVFSELQVLPDNGQPITSWPNRDEALLNVARGIRRAIEGLTEPKK